MDGRITKIGKQIRKLRKEKGYISYDHFSYEHKIPRVQYWRMEAGTNFTINSLLRVLDVHEIGLKEFFAGMEE